MTIGELFKGASPGGIAMVAVLVVAFMSPAMSSPGMVLAVLVLAIGVGGGLKLAPRVLQSIAWHRPIRLLREPVPERWAEIVRHNIPLSRALAPEDFDRLLKLTQLFLKKKKMEGAGGLELNDEIRVTVAAQACLLLVWRDTGLFPGLRTVIVYPQEVVPRYVEDRHTTGTIRTRRNRGPILGQSWGVGVVILSWDSARHGAFDPADGHNVVLHEFAHQLDQETGAADGVPVGLELSAIKPWAKTLERRYKQLRKARRTGKRTVLDHYGATNEAEFFAVATEAFFEKPRQLRKRKPDLYELLSAFYGVDAAEDFRPRWSTSSDVPQ